MATTPTVVPGLSATVTKESDGTSLPSGVAIQTSSTNALALSSGKLRMTITDNTVTLLQDPYGHSPPEQTARDLCVGLGYQSSSASGHYIFGKLYDEKAAFRILWDLTNEIGVRLHRISDSFYLVSTYASGETYVDDVWGSSDSVAFVPGQRLEWFITPTRLVIVYNGAKIIDVLNVATLMASQFPGTDLVDIFQEIGALNPANGSITDLADDFGFGTATVVPFPSVTVNGLTAGIKTAVDSNGDGSEDVSLSCTVTSPVGTTVQWIDNSVDPESSVATGTSATYAGVTVGTHNMRCVVTDVTGQVASVNFTIKVTLGGSSSRTRKLIAYLAQLEETVPGSTSEQVDLKGKGRQ